MSGSKLARTSAAVGVALLVAAGLSGCTSGPASNPGEGNWGWFASEVTLKDGRTVPCVAVGQGGVSCDWESAK